MATMYFYALPKLVPSVCLATVEAATASFATIFVSHSETAFSGFFHHGFFSRFLFLSVMTSENGGQKLICYFISRFRFLSPSGFPAFYFGPYNFFVWAEYEPYCKNRCRISAHTIFSMGRIRAVSKNQSQTSAHTISCMGRIRAV